MVELPGLLALEGIDRPEEALHHLVADGVAVRLGDLVGLTRAAVRHGELMSRLSRPARKCAHAKRRVACRCPSRRQRSRQGISSHVERDGHRGQPPHPRGDAHARASSHSSAKPRRGARCSGTGAKTRRLRPNPEHDHPADRLVVGAHRFAAQRGPGPQHRGRARRLPAGLPTPRGRRLPSAAHHARRR